MAISLSSRHQQYLHFVGRLLKPLHNQLPSQYRSQKASYSNFSPKIGCHGNILQHLWTPIYNVIHWAHPSSQPKWHLDRFSRFCTDDRRVSLYFTMGCPFSLSKLPLPMGDLDSYLTHGSLGPPDSSTQTAPWSVQLFLQGSLVWQIDQQTDRQTTLFGQ